MIIDHKVPVAKKRFLICSSLVSLQVFMAGHGGSPQGNKSIDVLLKILKDTRL